MTWQVSRPLSIIQRKVLGVGTASHPEPALFGGAVSDVAAMTRQTSPAFTAGGKHYEFLAPHTHEMRDAPRCGALSLLQKPLHYRGFRKICLEG
jgi:hypothetical protein